MTSVWLQGKKFKPCVLSLQEIPSPLKWVTPVQIITGHNAHISTQQTLPVPSVTTTESSNGDIPAPPTETKKSNFFDTLSLSDDSDKPQLTPQDEFVIALLDSDKDRCLQLLQGKEAKINAPVPKGLTPLIYAAQYGKLSMVQFLIENKASPSYVQNHAALLAATTHGHNDVVSYLLQQNAHIGYFHITNYRTSILEATLTGNIDLMLLLFQNKCDILHYDNNNRNILHYAVISGRLIVVQLAFSLALQQSKNEQAKINEQITSGKFFGQQQSSNSTTTTTISQQPPRVKRLQIDQKSEQGQTPLMYAVQLGFTNIAAWLMTLGAKIDIYANDGVTSPQNIAFTLKDPLLLELVCTGTSAVQQYNDNPIFEPLGVLDKIRETQLSRKHPVTSSSPSSLALSSSSSSSSSSHCHASSVAGEETNVTAVANAGGTIAIAGAEATISGNIHNDNVLDPHPLHIRSQRDDTTDYSTTTPTTITLSQPSLNDALPPSITLEPSQSSTSVVDSDDLTRIPTSTVLPNDSSHRTTKSSTPGNSNNGLNSTASGNNSSSAGSPANPRHPSSSAASPAQIATIQSPSLDTKYTIQNHLPPELVRQIAAVSSSTQTESGCMTIPDPTSLLCKDVPVVVIPHLQHTTIDTQPLSKHEMEARYGYKNPNSNTAFPSSGTITLDYDDDITSLSTTIPSPTLTPSHGGIQQSKYGEKYRFQIFDNTKQQYQNSSVISISQLMGTSQSITSIPPTPSAAAIAASSSKRTPLRSPMSTTTSTTTVTSPSTTTTTTPNPTTTTTMATSPTLPPSQHPLMSSTSFATLRRKPAPAPPCVQSPSSVTHPPNSAISPLSSPYPSSQCTVPSRPSRASMSAVRRPIVPIAAVGTSSPSIITSPQLTTSPVASPSAHNPLASSATHVHVPGPAPTAVPSASVPNSGPPPASAIPKMASPSASASASACPTIPTQTPIPSSSLTSLAPPTAAHPSSPLIPSSSSLSTVLPSTQLSSSSCHAAQHFPQPLRPHRPVHSTTDLTLPPSTISAATSSSISPPAPTRRSSASSSFSAVAAASAAPAPAVPPTSTMDATTTATPQASSTSICPPSSPPLQSSSSFQRLAIPTRSPTLSSMYSAATPSIGSTHTVVISRQTQQQQQQQQQRQHQETPQQQPQSTFASANAPLQTHSLSTAGSVDSLPRQQSYILPNDGAPVVEELSMDAFEQSLGLACSPPPATATTVNNQFSSSDALSSPSLQKLPIPPPPSSATPFRPSRPSRASIAPLSKPNNNSPGTTNQQQPPAASASASRPHRPTISIHGQTSAR